MFPWHVNACVYSEISENKVQFSAIEINDSLPSIFSSNTIFLPQDVTPEVTEIGKYLHPQTEVTDTWVNSKQIWVPSYEIFRKLFLKFHLSHLSGKQSAFSKDSVWVKLNDAIHNSIVCLVVTCLMPVCSSLLSEKAY